MTDLQANLRAGIHTESMEEKKSLVPDLPPGRELEDSPGLVISALPNASDANPATLALHADESLDTCPDVSPPIHVSTTFRYPKDSADLVSAVDKTVCFSISSNMFGKTRRWVLKTIYFIFFILKSQSRNFHDSLPIWPCSISVFLRSL